MEKQHQQRLHQILLCTSPPTKIEANAGSTSSVYFTMFHSQMSAMLLNCGFTLLAIGYVLLTHMKAVCVIVSSPGYLDHSWSG